MAKIEHIHGSIVRVDGQEVDLRYLKARIQRLTGMMEHMQKEYQGLKRKRRNAINTLKIIMEAIDGEVIDGERADCRDTQQCKAGCDTQDQGEAIAGGRAG